MFEMPDAMRRHREAGLLAPEPRPHASQTSGPAAGQLLWKLVAAVADAPQLSRRWFPPAHRWFAVPLELTDLTVTEIKT